MQVHLERPCYQPFGKSDPLGLKKPIVLFTIGDCNLRLGDFCVSPFCKLPALIPLILNEPAALSLGKTNPANLVLNAGAVELQGHVRSEVRSQAVKSHPLVQDCGTSALDLTRKTV